MDKLSPQPAANDASNGQESMGDLFRKHPAAFIAGGIALGVVAGALIPGERAAAWQRGPLRWPQQPEKQACFSAETRVTRPRILAAKDAMCLSVMRVPRSAARPNWRTTLEPPGQSWSTRLWNLLRKSGRSACISQLRKAR